MKEFVLPLEPFNKGLHPFKQNDNSYLLNGYDMRIIDKGSEAINFNMPNYITSVVLYALGIDVNKDFPQVFPLFGFYYLLTETKLYLLNEDSITEINMLDAYTKTSSEAIANGKWSLAYLGNTVIFTNGLSSIFKQPNVSYWQVENTIHIESCVEFKGHIITAGFDDTYFNEAWKLFYTSNQSSIIQPQIIMDKNTLAWGAINAGDLFWIFFPYEAFRGPLGFENLLDYSFYKDWIYRGDSGSINIPELDGIKAVIRSGNMLYVYGTKRSVICQFIIEPVISISIVTYLDYGLQNKHAIAGNDINHFIIDNKNNLRKISNGQDTKLGFPKFLSDDNYSLCYHEKYDEVYINGALKSYSYNKGLMDLGYNIPSAFSYKNIEYLIYK